MLVTGARQVGKTTLLRHALRSYVETYIERDVRTAGDIRELAVFSRFLGLAAALTAQEINSSQFGRELGVKPDTARRWTDLLAATFQWRELLPYHGNAIKRLSGKSKGLFFLPADHEYMVPDGWWARGVSYSSPSVERFRKRW